MGNLVVLGCNGRCWWYWYCGGGGGSYSIALHPCRHTCTQADTPFFCLNTPLLLFYFMWIPGLLSRALSTRFSFQEKASAASRPSKKEAKPFMRVFMTLECICGALLSVQCAACTGKANDAVEYCETPDDRRDWSAFAFNTQFIYDISVCFVYAARPVCCTDSYHSVVLENNVHKYFFSAVQLRPTTWTDC